MDAKITKIVGSFMTIVGGIGWAVEAISGEGAAAAATDLKSGVTDRCSQRLKIMSMMSRGSG